MNEQYLTSAESINELALFFANEGYQTETQFLSHHMSMSITIYFDNIIDKEKIEHLLNLNAKERDFVIARHHRLGNNAQFYTLTLTKHPS